MNILLFIFAVIGFIIFGSLFINLLKKLDSKIITPQFDIIRFDETSDLDDNINYINKELLELREIKDNGQIISFVKKNKKKMIINFLITLTLLIPVLAGEIIVKLIGDYNSVSYRNFLDLVMVSYFLFITISLIYISWKYISCEFLEIDLNSGVCVREKFNQIYKFPLEHIKNILIVKEKYESKIHVYIYFEIENLKRLEITTIGKYNFLERNGDNYTNAISLAKGISNRIKKDILIQK